MLLKLQSFLGSPLRLLSLFQGFKLPVWLALTTADLDDMILETLPDYTEFLPLTQDTQNGGGCTQDL